jgi:hypothetical protein
MTNRRPHLLRLSDHLARRDQKDRNIEFHRAGGEQGDDEAALKSY